MALRGGAANILWESGQMRRACSSPCGMCSEASFMTWCRTPRQTRNRPPVRPDHILEVLPHGLLITKVVVLFHQAVEQRFVRSMPHRLELDGWRSLNRPWIGVLSINIRAGGWRFVRGLGGV